jgi:hypothetical protein
MNETTTTTYYDPSVHKLEERKIYARQEIANRVDDLADNVDDLRKSQEDLIKLEQRSLEALEAIAHYFGQFMRSQTKDDRNDSR